MYYLVTSDAHQYHQNLYPTPPPPQLINQPPPDGLVFQAGQAYYRSGGYITPWFSS